MLVVLDQVDSTNTFLKNHFDEFPDGAVVAALEQTAGRGRLGRPWLQQKNNDIALSVVFKKLETGFHAGAIVGLAALEVAREAMPQSELFFKWPNDLYSADKKLAGILSEGIWRQGRLAGVVCGIGINVNSDENALCAIGQPATSFFALCGQKFEIKNLLERLEKSIARHYIKYERERAQILHDWRRENRLLGRMIELSFPDGKRLEAQFSGIDADGNLIALCNGETTVFGCGDVKILPTPAKR